ncbi:hypothetical protein NMY22_g16753 [Coprinellus aureogranulatus]|nr:hypothetical protein NMY22_g16753 [Coprinellus aureogranulatus]
MLFYGGGTEKECCPGFERWSVKLPGNTRPTCVRPVRLPTSKVGFLRSRASSSGVAELKRENMPPPPVRTPSSVVPASNTEFKVGDVYDSFDELKKVVLNSEGKRGHKWITGWSYKDNHGDVYKVTLTCNRARKHGETHSRRVDGREWRQGNSIKNEYPARVNATRVGQSGLCHITLVSLDHNHGPQIELGGRFRKPATQEQKDVIRRLATSKVQTFTRGQIADVLDANKTAGSRLEPRQVSNIMAHTRKDARAQAEEDSLDGQNVGDFQAMVNDLTRRNEVDPGWLWFLKLDEHKRVVGIWWASPRQVRLLRRYYDILINDNTYGRNKYGFALGIAIVIDGQGCSRNVWYCLVETENMEMHIWCLRNSLKASGDRHPDTFISDRDRALISAVKDVFPFAFHVYCLSHISGNVDKNLARLATPWPNFQSDFWSAFRAVSPTIFDKLWNSLCTKYPKAKDYLNDNLGYQNQWACRIREQNDEDVMGPKSTTLQVYHACNERAKQQDEKAARQARDSARRHPHPIEGIFPAPVHLLRTHSELYPFQVCFKQMQESVYYSVEIIPKPENVRNWDEYAVSVQNEPGFQWSHDEEKDVFNNFTNDSAYLATPWLLRLITAQSHVVEQLVKVIRDSQGSRVFHVVALLTNGGYVCDCAMGLSMGIPCRHFFAVLKKSANLKLRLDIIAKRWYKDPNLNVTSVHPVSASESAPAIHRPPVTTTPTTSFANPLHPSRLSAEPPSTRTLPAREVQRLPTGYPERRIHPRSSPNQHKGGGCRLSVSWERLGVEDPGSVAKGIRGQPWPEFGVVEGTTLHGADEEEAAEKGGGGGKREGGLIVWLDEASCGEHHHQASSLVSF